MWRVANLPSNVWADIQPYHLSSLIALYFVHRFVLYHHRNASFSTYTSKLVTWIKARQLVERIHQSRAISAASVNASATERCQHVQIVTSRAGSAYTAMAGPQSQHQLAA